MHIFFCSKCCEQKVGPQVHARPKSSGQCTTMLELQSAAGQQWAQQCVQFGGRLFAIQTDAASEKRPRSCSAALRCKCAQQAGVEARGCAQGLEGCKGVRTPLAAARNQIY